MTTCSFNHLINNVFNLTCSHPSWMDILQEGLSQMEPDYLKKLTTSTTWLPGQKQLFSAFSLPFDQVNYVLFGESPYPRRESANGYAFWDASIDKLWSSTGLDKKVNRATSFRNIIKMLLIAEKLLDKRDVSQEAIARINKYSLVQTNEQLFKHFLNKGFLLLNTTLVLQSGSPKQDANAWAPFMKHLLHALLKKHAHIELILLGRIAETVNHLTEHHPHKKICALHPYNHTFITDPKMLDFFEPLHLLINPQM